MITSLGQILKENNIDRKETVYYNSCPDLFGFPIVSGNFYDTGQNGYGKKKLLFKNSVNISDFAGILKKIPKLDKMDFPGRDTMPFLQRTWEKFRKHWKKGVRSQ